MDTVVALEGLCLSSAGRLLLAGVSWAAVRGTTVVLAGPSGAGKSLSLQAAAGVLPGSVRVVGGTVSRMGRVAWCPQDGGLDPLLRVGAQLAETGVTDPETWLTAWGLDPRLARAWPDQLSGGERQRAALALATAARPDALLADERTAGLDPVTQADLLGRLHRWRGNRRALVWVTHDLAAAAPWGTTLVVLAEGRTVEAGDFATIAAAAAHPVTRSLWEASVG
ncbi:MAG: ATP-binding cassette domain-containing protein [Actinomycetia bacterium]|nr:ATP-binding cassette domain-containing protein [Actinomycetes bacterium]